MFSALNSQLDSPGGGGRLRCVFPRSLFFVFRFLVKKKEATLAPRSDFHVRGLFWPRSWDSRLWRVHRQLWRPLPRTNAVLTQLSKNPVARFVVFALGIDGKCDVLKIFFCQLSIPPLMSEFSSICLIRWKEKKEAHFQHFRLKHERFR